MADFFNLKGTTALMRASQEGHAEISRLLINAGADVNKKNYEGMNALMLASQRGHAAMVMLLIKSPCAMDEQTQQGSTALMLACKRGHDECVKVLVAMGAEIFIRDNRGRTARDTAMRRNHSHLLELLDTQAQIRLHRQFMRSERRQILNELRDAAEVGRVCVDREESDCINLLRALRDGDESVHNILRGLSRHPVQVASRQVSTDSTTTAALVESKRDDAMDVTDSADCLSGLNGRAPETSFNSLLARYGLLSVNSPTAQRGSRVTASSATPSSAATSSAASPPTSATSASNTAPTSTTSAPNSASVLARVPTPAPTHAISSAVTPAAPAVPPSAVPEAPTATAPSAAANHRSHGRPVFYHAAAPMSYTLPAVPDARLHPFVSAVIPAPSAISYKPWEWALLMRRCMDLPGGIFDLIMDFMPMPGEWTWALEILKRRCQLQPQQSMLDMCKLMDEILADAGIFKGSNQSLLLCRLNQNPQIYPYLSSEWRMSPGLISSTRVWADVQSLMHRTMPDFDMAFKLPIIRSMHSAACELSRWSGNQSHPYRVLVETTGSHAAANELLNRLNPQRRMRKRDDGMDDDASQHGTLETIMEQDTETEMQNDADADDTQDEDSDAEAEAMTAQINFGLAPGSF